MSSTATAPRSQEILEHAEQLAGALHTAADATRRASELAEQIYREIEREQPLERLNFEALMCAKGIAIDLGVDTGDGSGELDLNRNAGEAEDLVNMIRLASGDLDVATGDVCRTRRWAELQALGLFLTMVAENVQDALDETPWDDLVVTSGSYDRRDSMEAFTVALHARNPTDDTPEMVAVWEIVDRIEAQICALVLAGAGREAMAKRIGWIVNSL
jgi:hypothetical protein